MHQKILFLATSAAMAASLGTPTQAQDTNPQRALEEIVVTAQKRTENLQDVPISISLVTAEDITALNIQDFTETAKLTPGVDLNPGLQAAAIRLRGVGPGFFAVNNPQSVAVFVDEVAQAQVGAVFATLVDVERLELLRGPQGTLYGQNAPGGVYNISTRRPNVERLEGYLEGSYSMFDDADLATTDLRGAVNFPLIEDRLGWRLAGVYADSDGFVTIENPDSPDDTTGGKDHQALRSRMLFNATEEIELLWTMNYQDLTDYQVGFNPDGLVPGTGGSNPVPATYNDFDDRRYYGAFRSEVNADITDTSLHGSWDTDWALVEAIGFYQEFDTDSLENREPYPNGSQQFNIDLEFEVTSLELRISDSGDVFDYVAGLYYWDRTADSLLDLQVFSAPVVGGGKETSETYSAYANVTWHINDKWDFSGGLRYDDNSLDVDAEIDLAGQFQSVLDDDFTFDHVSWSAKLRYFIDANTTAYLAADNAFKQGGFNLLLGAAVDLGSIPGFEESGALAAEQIYYDEETSTAYEIGIKGTTDSRTVQYRVAIFYQEFDDHHISHDAPDGSLGLVTDLFTNTITNADKVTTQGIEFDFTWLISDYWQLSNRTAYFDAEADEWSNHFCSDSEFMETGEIVCPLEGEPLNALPQWNTNTQLAYQRLLDNGWDFYSNLSWTWQSEPNYTDNTDRFDEDKSRFDASLGMRSADLGLDLRIWGKNLTDEDLNTNPGLKPNGDPNLPPAFEGDYYRGLEYGLTVSYSF